MAAASDAIRQDIEDTRDRLGREIDELADRTLPHRIVKRHWPIRRNKAKRAAEEIIDDPGALVQAAAEDVELDSVLDPEPNDVTDEVRRSARGRLILAGLAVVGVGVVITWLIRRRSGDE